MTQRTNHFQSTPLLSKKLMELSGASSKSTIGHNLIHLIDIRVSQMNGCAFCLDMHIKQAKMDGEQEIRIYHLSIWRESPLFSDKEKAALEMAEAMTKLDLHGISDALYDKARTFFSEIEMSEISYAVGLINLWNRLQIVSQFTPGSKDKEFGLDKSGL